MAGKRCGKAAIVVGMNQTESHDVYKHIDPRTKKLSKKLKTVLHPSLTRCAQVSSIPRLISRGASLDITTTRIMSQESLAAPKYTMTRQCQVYLNSANLDTLAPSKLSASTHNNKPNPYRLRPAVWDDEFDDNSPREDQPYPMPPWRYESPPYGSSYDYRRLPVSTIEHSTPPSPETLPPRYKLRPWKSPTNPTYQAGIPPSATYESPYPPVFYSPMWNSPSSLSYIYRGLRPFEPPAQPSRVDEPPRPGPAQAEPTLGSTSSGDDLDPTLSNTDMLLQANVAQESPSMRPELISNEHRLNSDLFSDPLPIGSPEDNEQDETEEEKVLMDLLPIDDDAISRESSTSSRAGTSEYNPPRIRLIPPRPPPIILTPKKQDWPQIGSVLGKNHESTPTLTSLTNGAASGRSALSPSKYSTIELTVSQSERKESE